MITTNNYELFLLRYSEGLLDEEQCHEVERFLADHPEAAEELALFQQSPRLKREPLAFPGTIPGLEAMPLSASSEGLHRRGWLRYAAAALLLLALGGASLLFWHREEAASPMLAQRADAPMPAVTVPASGSGDVMPPKAEMDAGVASIAAAEKMAESVAASSSAAEQALATTEEPALASATEGTLLAEASPIPPDGTAALSEEAVATEARPRRARLILTDQLICFLPEEPAAADTPETNEPLLAQTDGPQEEGSWGRRTRRLGKLSVKSILTANLLYERLAPRAEQLYNHINDNISKYDIFS